MVCCFSHEFLKKRLWDFDVFDMGVLFLLRLLLLVLCGSLLGGSWLCFLRGSEMRGGGGHLDVARTCNWAWLSKIWLSLGIAVAIRLRSLRHLRHIGRLRHELWSGKHGLLHTHVWLTNSTVGGHIDKCIVLLILIGRNFNRGKGSHDERNSSHCIKR